MAEEPDEVVLKKCFRTPNQLFYGHVKRHENGNTWVRHGMGKLISTKGDEDGRFVVSTYEGWFDNDQISGNGTYTFQDGSIYEGDMVNGIAHGDGRMTWPDGSIYEGSWVDGEMEGQGKFVAEKGEFMEGDFHRNCFFFRGAWTDIIDDVIRYRETEALLGSDHIQSPVIFCFPDATNLHETAERVLQDNLIPFIIADSEIGDPLLYLGDNVLHLGHAVHCRRRHQDFKKLFYSGIQRALEDGSMFSLAFSGGIDDEIPDTWALDNFFEPFSFPLELFNPKVFRGRPTLQKRFTTEDHFGNLCRFAIVSGPIKMEVTQETDPIRDAVYGRYGRAVPLHRCAIIVLTSLH